MSYKDNDKNGKCNICGLIHDSSKDPYYNIAAIILITCSISLSGYYMIKLFKK